MKYENFKLGDSSEHKTVLVTGATGILGQAICRQMSEAGWKVIIHYHQDYKAARRLASELDQALPISCDLRNYEESNLEKFVNAIKQNFGIPGAVVHCASMPMDAVLLLNSRAKFIDHVNVYVFSLIYLFSAFLPAMQKRQDGAFVGVLTEAIAPPAVPGWSAYASAKAALASYLVSLSEEVKNSGIRIIGIYPGALGIKSGKVSLPVKSRQSIKLRWPVSCSPEQVAQIISTVINSKEEFKNGYHLRINHRGDVEICHPFGISINETLNASVTYKPGVFKEDEADETSEQTGKGKNGIDSKLVEIFRRMFNLDKRFPVEESSFGKLEGWDSVKQIELILEIEKTFNIRFLSSEISKLLSFKDIIQSIGKKII